MSVFLFIAGVVIGVIGLVVPGIAGGAFIVSGAVLFAAGFIVIAIEAMHTTLALGKSNFKMNVRTQRQCPACREIVRIDALRCKFCTTAMQPSAVAPDPTAPPQFEQEAPATVPAPRQVNPKAL